MRLKSIKLAGFKSFVDPTTVPFPSNLSAIVGPNGCGKSNVIDAVRWVMGESSAKNLRGESMTDVIFNGSSGRKPVGQASIELVFDNSEGKLVGEYAKFNEISVKRKVTRDAQSHYFLNGTKCRRRDITDLFLGTGLGPRSYAIIEQGMISKLIESKPEELRVFLEEAAGISKYKERRKETESRMRRTQENLDRLGDLREELGRQLQHLQKQAQSAEKYTALKKQERELKAQLNAIKWKKLDDDVIQWDKAVSELELALEKVLYSRTSNESEIEKLRLDHQQKAESFNKIQTHYYEFAAQIARMEQKIQFQKERALQLKTEISSVVDTVREARQQVDHDREKLLDVDQELDIAVPHLEELALKLETSSERLEQSEKDMHDWQNHWEAFNRTTADARKNSEIHQSKIQFFEESIRKLEQRLEKNRGDADSLDAGHQTVALDELQEALLVFEEQEFAKREELDVSEQQKRETKSDIESLGKVLLEHQKNLQIIEGQLSSKYALQSESESTSDDEGVRVLNEHGFVEFKTLADCIDVEPKWADAAEHVLARLLSAYVIGDTSTELLQSLYESQSGISIIHTSAESNDQISSRKTLYDCVKNAPELKQYLSGIYLAESLDEARECLSGLPMLASVITTDGVWLHKEFTLYPNQKSAASGYLKRKNEILKLEEEKQLEEDKVQEFELEISRLKEQFVSSEHKTEACNKELMDIIRGKSDLSARLAAEKTRSAHVLERLKHLEEEQTDLVNQINEEKGELEERRMMWQEALESLESLSDEHENLLMRRDDLRAKLDNLRAQNRQERDSHHQAQLQVQGLKNQRQSFNTNMERASIQLERMEERKLVLEESLAENEEPLELVQHELEDALERRMNEEERLAIARQALDQVEQSMSALEKQRSASENEVSLKRSELERKRMELQALEIRRGNVLESIQKDEFILEELLLALPGDAEVATWEEEIQKVESRVSRLGAINLAAIDEYKIQSERKTFLDAQDEDLNEALATLEEAIRKIDRETKARFKETYDKVNHGLQALFPKVFGGGSAYLDLTGDDLLETGVSIMARPPGKKNSTIHLLSGGEKALTAIALIFSIFQLNPAPFCMLDEVDAPLDDANVARYANMVREMSSQVQFIYITHNKIAMEMADQLMGVTMHEPGVSRLVTVDVEEAAALAAI